MTNNNTNNTVSIITPVYNGEKYIAQTIESVLAQTYPDWEMLIIDDGSRDNSAAIARDYCARDSRISLYSQTNASRCLTLTTFGIALSLPHSSTS